MKKIVSLIFLFIIAITLSSCSGKGCDLLILNWGDYIAEDLIYEFEELYQCDVKVATTDSNEQMYSSVLNKTAEYDLVVPSDYMIDQMMKEDLLLEIDYSKLSNYSDDLFVPQLKDLMDSDDCSGYKGYYVPYFWGTLGIMYNKRAIGVEEAVMEHGWDVFFEQNLLPDGSKVGMYAVSRDALALAELYLGYSLNTTDISEINHAMDVLRTTDFYKWGTDDLKIDVSQGKVDIALVYSGDFFDSYYADLEAEDEDSEESNVDNYSIYSPSYHNNVFFDALVIPNTCTNEDLAYKFLDFMLDHDNSYINAEFVGYCPTVKSVYDEITSDIEGWGDILEIESYDPNNIIEADNSWVEVYKYLGPEVYAHIEKQYTNVIFK